MSKIFKLKGNIQNYAWGGTHYIPELLDVNQGKKCAEYWLGAHVNAPSILETSDGDQPLDTYLQNNLEGGLGDSIADKFGRLPFLFKVLDVNDMLSIQVHPAKSEAEKGFNFENKKGIPLNAPNRNYKDDNHKPEIMVALSEFWLLHGFFSKSKLTQVLKSIPEFKGLYAIFEQEGYFGLYKKVMEQSAEESDHILRPLVDRILPLYQSRKLHKSNPDYWAAKAVDSSEDKSVLDKGIYSIYFFNIVEVTKGHAIFQDAGIPHAYLEGQNMELMANSDNVLRGGLTPKHVDVPELLKHVTFEETIPNIMAGELQEDGLERIYKSPAVDFELSRIELLKDSRYASISKTAEILFVIEGEMEILEGSKSLYFHKGEAAFISASAQYEIVTDSSVTIYKATAP